MHSKLDEIAHACTCFCPLGAHIVHTKVGVHTRSDLRTIGIRKLARPGPPDENQHIVEAFRHGLSPAETFHDGVGVMEMPMGLYRSAELGQTGPLTAGLSSDA